MLPYKSSSHSAKCVRCASLRSGGRRLAVRTAMEHPIGALLRTPFPASRDFPSRGNERYEGKNSESYTSRTISAFFPFGDWRHHLSPTSWGHYKAPLCCERLMKGMLRGVLFFPLNRGKSGVARIEGGERSEPVSRIVFMSYDTESKSRNASCVPFRGRGPRSGEGVDGGKNDYDTRYGRDRRKAAL